MNAVILAAGFGRRLLPLTKDIPKPLLKVRGKNLIDYHIESLSKAGIGKIIINTHYLPELIEDHVSEKYQGLDIQFSREDKILGTGGGLKQAASLLNDDPILVINTDNFLEEDYKKFISNSSSRVFVCKDQNGDFDIEDGKVKVGADKTYRFIGISIVKKSDILEVCHDEFDYWQDYLKLKAIDGNLLAEEIDFNCYHVGTIESLNNINHE
jgi:MurNAc alpha-1-phosphate uridylyltransferase